MKTKILWLPRTKAAGLHFLLSFLVAGLAAVLVFGLWYPGPYRWLAGGRDLFLLVTAVDVAIGPLLTFAVFDRAKGIQHLVRDLVVIGLVQTAALAYGLHTVYVARPVAMIHEVDRFRMITADAVHTAELHEAQPAYQSLPLTGPWLLGTRRPRPGAERNDALFMGVGGIDISQRPRFWQPYEASRTQVLERARPLSELLNYHATRHPDLKQRVAQLNADETSGRFLPVVARGEGVAVLDAAGNVLGYLPVDGFF